MEYRKTVLKLSFLGLLINIILVLMKISAGLIFDSDALLSDGVHSLADVVTTFAVAVSAYIARRFPKLINAENCASLLTSAALIFTGAVLGKNGVRALIIGEAEKNFSMIPVITAVICVILKWGAYRFTVREGKRINSEAFIAEGYHDRADALCSLCTVLGLFGEKLGYFFAEPLACVMTSCMIIKTGVGIIRGTVSRILNNCRKKT